MTASRHPKVSRTLRVIAGACAVFWLVGPLLCGAERISDCGGHDEPCAGEASPDHHDDIVSAHEHEQSQDAAQAHHHEDSETQHEHGSEGKKPCDEKICCSTMQALVSTAKPTFIATSLSQHLFTICPLNAAGDQSLAASNCKLIRQAKHCEWVFTLGVCLDAALHALAPPSSPAVG